MKNISILLAYDGTHFLGWQKTYLGPTIEESLERVLQQIFQEPIILQAASRTDAGVHADGQRVNFFTKKNIPSLLNLQKSLNALLPPSIVVLNIAENPLSFHPTLDNIGKEYHYFICNTPYQLPKYRLTSWHIPSPLNLNLLQTILTAFIGTHDFTSFCNTDGLEDNKNPICTLHNLSYQLIEKNRICFSVTGNRFLFRMVRILIGTLAYVGMGKISTEEALTILPSKLRSKAGVTAPAHGLHLIQVFYKNQIPEYTL